MQLKISNINDPTMNLYVLQIYKDKFPLNISEKNRRAVIYLESNDTIDTINAAVDLLMFYKVALIEIRYSNDININQILSNFQLIFRRLTQEGLFTYIASNTYGQLNLGLLY